MPVDCAKLTRRRALAFKVETTTGTAEELVAGDANLDAQEPDIKYDDNSTPRESASLSWRPRIAGVGTATVTFQNYLSGSGGASVPAIANVLTCCGLKLTGGVLSPLTATDCGNTGTFGLFKSGRFKRAFGVAGNMKFTGTTGKPVLCEFTGKGKWDPDNHPSDVAMITPAYIDVVPPILHGITFTIGGAAYRIPGFELDLGNDVQLRESITAVGGYHAAQVVAHDRRLMISPEALPLSTRDWYAAHRDATEFAWAATIGDEDGNIIQFAAPKIQLVSPPEDEDTNGFFRDKLVFQFNQSADAGDDELSISFDTAT